MWSGGTPCHQVITGASGANNGRTTDSACRLRRPNMRMTTASPGPSRPPMETSASNRELAASSWRRTTMSSRHGWAAAAVVAALSATPTCFSSTTTTRVSARPKASAPAERRSAANALTTSEPVVSHRVVIGRLPGPSVHGPSESTVLQSPPGAPAAGGGAIALAGLTAAASDARPGRASRRRRPGPSCRPGSGTGRSSPSNPPSGRSPATIRSPRRCSGTVSRPREARRG